MDEANPCLDTMWYPRIGDYAMAKQKPREREQLYQCHPHSHWSSMVVGTFCQALSLQVFS